MKRIKALAFLYCLAAGLVLTAQAESWLASPVRVEPTHIDLLGIYVPCDESDATAAIQRAVGMAAAQGGTVYLSPCVYELSAPIEARSSIDGRGAVLEYAEPARAGIALNPADRRPVKISNMTIRGRFAASVSWIE